jgi:hypothetical protein
MRSPGGVEKPLPDATVMQVIVDCGVAGQSEVQNPYVTYSPRMYGKHQIIYVLLFLEGHVLQTFVIMMSHFSNPFRSV